MKLRYASALFALALFVASCSEESRHPLAPEPSTPMVPLFGEITPANGHGACMSNDAVTAGVIKAGATLNCTANDTKIALTVLNTITTSAGTFTYDPNVPITCNEGEPITLNMNAEIQTNATARYDLGVWVATDGGNGNTGTCDHFNLIPGQNGSTQLDQDRCGDMGSASGKATIPLGSVQSVCTPNLTTGTLHIGACVAWDQNDKQFCPVNDVNDPLAYRLGTVPGTSSKCNCDGIDLPVQVNQIAHLEVVKSCVPSTDGGKFNLQIDGTTQKTDATCTGPDNTTTSLIVPLGTNINQDRTHRFGEMAGTSTSLGDYTSTRACVNRAGGSRLASAAGTGGSITLAPNDDVVCTITNTRAPGKIELKKVVLPSSDPGVFNLAVTSSSSVVVASASSVGNNGTTGSGGTSVAPGTYALSETQGNGTLLTNYTPSGPVCANRSDGTNVTVSSGSVNIASNSDIVCTITNTRNTGKIELRKSLSPSNDPGKFDLSVNSSTPTLVASASNVGDGGTTGAGGTPVVTGNYTLAETAHVGTTMTDYAASAAVCVTRVGSAPVTVTAGVVAVANNADIVCTITNTRNQGKIELKKVVSPSNDPGVFNLAVTSSSSAVVASATGVGNNGTTGIGGTVVAPGTYALSEAAGNISTVLANYTQSGPACVNRSGGNVNVLNGSVDVASNSDILCTITNTRNPGKIELKKALSPSNDPGRFDLSVTSSTPSVVASASNVGDGGTTGAGGNSVAPGTYTLGEAAHSGTTIGNYTASAAVCVDRTSGGSVTVTGANVQIASNADVVCTITNTRNTGKLELRKSLSPSNDGGKFNLSIKAGTSSGTEVASATDVGDGGTTTSGGITLNTGGYHLSETVGAGTTGTEYVMGSPVCVNRSGGATVPAPSGVVTLAKNADVVCTITNTRNARIIITKTITGSISISSTYDFSRDASASIGTTTLAQALGNGGTDDSGYTLAAGTYRICELNVPAGTTVTATVNSVGGNLVDPNPTAGVTNLCINATVGAGGTSTVAFTNGQTPSGGGTRTIGYWKNWSSCTGGQQFTKATATGGVGIGKTLNGNIGDQSSIYPIGDLVPGMLYANTLLTPNRCQQIVSLLSKDAYDGTKRAGDPIYSMVAQLIGAKLNISAGAGVCPLLSQALIDAQALLIEVHFNGTNVYVKKTGLTALQSSRANTIAGILDQYNNGQLVYDGCPSHAG